MVHVASQARIEDIEARPKKEMPETPEDKLVWNKLCKESGIKPLVLKKYQEEAAEKMRITRATFGRIISRARQKTDEGILNGKAIRINEKKGEYSSIDCSDYCKSCGHHWKSKLNSRG